MQRLEEHIVRVRVCVCVCVWRDHNKTHHFMETMLCRTRPFAMLQRTGERRRRGMLSLPSALLSRVAPYRHHIVEASCHGLKKERLAQDHEDLVIKVDHTSSPIPMGVAKGSTMTPMGKGFSAQSYQKRRRRFIHTHKRLFDVGALSLSLGLRNIPSALLKHEYADTRAQA